MRPQRIVILGGGFGGAYCARGLARARGGQGAEVVLLDRHNYLLFYPLLVEAGIGELEPRHVTVPIRAFLPGAMFRLAEVKGVDFHREEVLFQGMADRQPQRLRYDQLVIALGSVTQLPDLPGLREHGFELKSLGDAAVNCNPAGQPYPATAQHAVREGLHLTRNLVRVMRGEPPEPFHYRAHGAVAAVGCRTGVAKICGLKLTGFPAWWMYRTIYLLKMPGLARKARVVLDWTTGLIFPRDFVQLALHRPARSERSQGAK